MNTLNKIKQAITSKSVVKHNPCHMTIVSNINTGASAKTSQK